jgi:hypothetical protein
VTLLIVRKSHDGILSNIRAQFFAARPSGVTPRKPSGISFLSHNTAPGRSHDSKAAGDWDPRRLYLDLPTLVR